MTTPITCRGRNRLVSALLIFGLTATAASAWALTRGFGWGFIAGCALFTVLIGLQSLRLRSLYLHLDEIGFETASRFEDKMRVRWSEVEHIELVKTDRDPPDRGEEAIRVVYSTPESAELLIEDEYDVPIREILRALQMRRM